MQELQRISKEMQVRRAPRALEQGEPTLNVGTTELNGRAPTLNVLFFGDLLLPLAAAPPNKDHPVP